MPFLVAYLYLPELPELHCWLSSHAHCIKMLGLCFRVYVRRSQGAGTDPAQDSIPRACHRELDARKYPILFVLRKRTEFLQTQWVMCMALPHMWNKKKGALIKPWPPATKKTAAHCSKASTMVSTALRLSCQVLPGSSLATAKSIEINGFHSQKSHTMLLLSMFFFTKPFVKTGCQAHTAARP